MAFGIINNVSIKGISAAVPCGFIETGSYEEKFGASGIKRFKKMTGVLKRHISIPEQTASDLCFVAAEKLLDYLKWDRSSVDTLILVTPTPDYKIPATSCVLQHRLGLSESCMAIDINLGCSGYVYGLTVASSFMRGSVRRALLLVGDSPNMDVATEDKSTTMLFSDAGAATALEVATGDIGMNYLLRTDGSGFKHIIKPVGGARIPRGSYELKDWGDGVIRNDYQNYMNGAEVFKFSIDKPVNAHFDFFEKSKLDVNSFDHFVFHQANKFIIDNIVQRVSVPVEKVPISIDRFGNTSGVSLPLTIVDLCQNKKNCNLKIILNAFGVGLSWGVMNIEINSDDCLPLIYTDDYFNDGLLEYTGKPL